MQQRKVTKLFTIIDKQHQRNTHQQQYAPATQERTWTDDDLLRSTNQSVNQPCWYEIL